MSTRADRLEALLADHEIDALLVTNLVNVRYLTGYTGSNGFALVGAGLRRFVTDFRYLTQAEEQVRDFDREQGPRELLGALEKGWPEGALRVGIEAGHMTVKTRARLGEIVPARIELVDAPAIVEELRAVKEPAELEAIASAARLADAALEQVLSGRLAGRTEREVAAELEFAQRRLGAEGVAFGPIVASGVHGSRPHAEPRDAKIERGVLVTIDWGARVDGYNSDCTRTVAVGEVSGELREIYELVERAQAAGLDAVATGRTGREVDAVARELIESAGHGEHFGHGLGHGLGLEVHEAPTLSRVGEKTLAPGNVVTVEPGVYVPGLGGVRIEDLVVVEEAGPRVLTSLPKSLLSVD